MCNFDVIIHYCISFSCNWL